METTKGNCSFAPFKRLHPGLYSIAPANRLLPSDGDHQASNQTPTSSSSHRTASRNLRSPPSSPRSGSNSSPEAVSSNTRSLQFSSIIHPHPWDELAESASGLIHINCNASTGSRPSIKSRASSVSLACDSKSGKWTSTQSFVDGSSVGFGDLVCELPIGQSLRIGDPEDSEIDPLSRAAHLIRYFRDPYFTHPICVQSQSSSFSSPSSPQPDPPKCCQLADRFRSVVRGECGASIFAGTDPYVQNFCEGRCGAQLADLIDSYLASGDAETSVNTSPYMYSSDVANGFKRECDLVVNVLQEAFSLMCAVNKRGSSPKMCFSTSLDTLRSMASFTTETPFIYASDPSEGDECSSNSCYRSNMRYHQLVDLFAYIPSTSKLDNWETGAMLRLDYEPVMSVIQAADAAADALCVVSEGGDTSKCHSMLHRLSQQQRAPLSTAILHQMIDPYWSQPSEHFQDGIASDQDSESVDELGCGDSCFSEMIMAVGRTTVVIGERFGSHYHRLVGSMTTSYGRYKCQRNSRGLPCADIYFKSAIRVDKASVRATFNDRVVHTDGEYYDCECPKSWIGDGGCDPLCFNQQCGFDGGDCEARRLFALPSYRIESIVEGQMGGSGGAFSAWGGGGDVCHPFDEEYVCSSVCRGKITDGIEEIGCCLGAGFELERLLVETEMSLLQGPSTTPMWATDMGTGSATSSVGMGSGVSSIARSVKWVEQVCDFTVDSVCSLGLNRGGVVMEFSVEGIDYSHLRTKQVGELLVSDVLGEGP
eukprot:GHVN01083312.1.p1 GENE.GHVN01083312.1~~GHVN01083312.1.p1  ORF type:complete len:763 (-),score=101.53 GHVN01083312.1:760-3048(-)